MEKKGPVLILPGTTIGPWAPVLPRVGGALCLLQLSRSHTAGLGLWPGGPWDWFQAGSTRPMCPGQAGRCICPGGGLTLEEQLLCLSSPPPPHLLLTAQDSHILSENLSPRRPVSLIPVILWLYIFLSIICWLSQPLEVGGMLHWLHSSLCHQTMFSIWCFTWMSPFHLEFLQVAGRCSLVWWRPYHIRKQDGAWVDLSAGSILTLTGHQNTLWASVSSSANWDFILGCYFPKQNLMSTSVYKV